MRSAINFLFVLVLVGEIEKEVEEEERAKAAEEGRGWKREEGRRNKSYHRCTSLDEPVPHAEWRGVKADVVLF